MKKLKCILWHNSWLTGLEDLIEEETENEKEIITTYTCKHCNKVIKRLKRLKPSHADLAFKHNTYDNERYDIKIREYEGWSICNTANIINVSSSHDYKGIIYFVSDQELSEVEIYGLYKMIETKLKKYEGLDINAVLSKPSYDKTKDMIKDYNYYGNYKTPTIIDASQYLLSDKDLLKNSKTIIMLEYKASPRYTKSKLWRLRNKRIFWVADSLNFEHYID